MKDEAAIDCPVLTWLYKVVPTSMPEHVVAFALNMTEGWRVELVGSSTYDTDDDDWACPPEAWSSPHELEIYSTLVGDTWESAQAYVLNSVSWFMNHDNSQGANTFRAAQAICVGFVDGHLVRVRPNSLND